MSLASQILARRMHLQRGQFRDVVCHRDLPVAMDDEVVLLADRWVSRDGDDRPQPTVLVRSPYGRRQFVGLLFGRLLAERGFQVVIQSVRGTFGSRGSFAPFDERPDGLATLRWLRSQPWHADRIAMIGPSYLGLVHNGRSPPTPETTWPPAGTEHRLWIGPDRSLVDEAPPAAGDEAYGYRYDPADPTQSIGGPVLLARDAVSDNRALEARPDVVTFSTEPLAVTREAIGPVWVALWVRADSDYFDLFARVCDVDQRGASLNVRDALVSVAPGVFPRDEPGTWTVSWSLWPIAHRFAAGHRIRLQVSSGAHPRYARNSGTGQDRTTSTELRPVQVAPLYGAEHPSVLVLPVCDP